MTPHLFQMIAFYFVLLQYFYALLCIILYMAVHNYTLHKIIVQKIICFLQYFYALFCIFFYLVVHT
jgi:hypothetical protein